MKTIFGVLSATPLNKKLKNGYTMRDWVMRQKGNPAFCMRTLCGAQPLTAEEMEFLHAKGCKIGLVLDDLTEAAVSTNNGTADALRAVEAAKAMGVPQNAGVALFAHIMPVWSINHNWMLSFAQTLTANGYAPGFIANTDSSKNFNFDRQCSHYVQATRGVEQFGAVYAATEPKLDGVPTAWEPYCPSALNPEDISLWVCGTTTFDSLTVEDVYARDENVLDCMW